MNARTNTVELHDIPNSMESQKIRKLFNSEGIKVLGIHITRGCQAFVRLDTANHAQQFVESHRGLLKWKDSDDIIHYIRLSLAFEYKHHSRRAAEINDGTLDIGTSPSPVVVLRDLDLKVTGLNIHMAMVGLMDKCDGLSAKNIARIFLAYDTYHNTQSQKDGNSFQGFAFVQLDSIDSARLALAIANDSNIYPNGFRILDSPVPLAFCRKDSWQYIRDGNYVLYQRPLSHLVETYTNKAIPDIEERMGLWIMAESTETLFTNVSAWSGSLNKSKCISPNMWMDLDLKVCLLCSRRFPNNDSLRRHTGLSQLHRHNLGDSEMISLAFHRLERIQSVKNTMLY